MSIAHPAAPKRHLAAVESTTTPAQDRLTPADLPRQPAYVLAGNMDHHWLIDWRSTTIYVSDQLGLSAVREALADATSAYFTQQARPQLVVAGG